MAMPDDLTTLVCLFHTDDQAQGALKDLRDAGFASGAVSVYGGSTPTANVGSNLLAEIGIPKRDRAHLQDALQDNGVLVTVAAVGGEQKTVEDIFEAHSAKKIDDERRDRYMNYRKFKPETQEEPVTLGSASATGPSVPEGGYANSLPAEDPVGDTVLVPRVVHVYRRDLEDPAL